MKGGKIGKNGEKKFRNELVKMFTLEIQHK